MSPSSILLAFVASLLVLQAVSLPSQNGFIACDMSLPCDRCQAIAGCGFCSLGTSGKCFPLTATEGNLTQSCANLKGTVVEATKCPVIAEPATCNLAASCGDCSATSGCGYCSIDASKNYGKCFSSVSIANDCGAVNGKVITKEQCPVIAQPTTCNLGASCGECSSTSGCGYCSIDASKNYGKCFSSTTIANDCGAVNGKVVTKEQCPAVVAPTSCNLASPCGDCQATEGCDYCSIDPSTNYGKCLSSSTAASECAVKKGSIVAKGTTCPAKTPVTNDWCEYSANCGDCTGNTKIACGYCSYNDGYSAKCMALKDFSVSGCEGMGGKMYVASNSSECPARPICSYSTCDECNADPACGSCLGVDKNTGKVWTKCLPLTVPTSVSNNVQTAEQYCSSKGGVLTPKTSEKCPIVPVIDECTSKSCSECVSNPKCSFCGGSFGDAAFGVCKPTATAAEYCPEIKGTLFGATSAACPAAPVANKTDDLVTDKINEGKVTEADLNEDINKNAPLNGFIVVVTVITQAKSEDGLTKFQTFVDITGETTPTDADKAAVCEALKKSLSTHLQVPAEGIDCSLTLKPTTKRVTNSYVANLTVNGAYSGVAAVIASLALVASCLFALLH